MGPITRGAIEDYQARHGLVVDGHATEELLAHLEETLATLRLEAVRGARWSRRRPWSF